CPHEVHHRDTQTDLRHGGGWDSLGNQQAPCRGEPRREDASDKQIPDPDTAHDEGRHLDYGAEGHLCLSGETQSDGTAAEPILAHGIRDAGAYQRDPTEGPEAYWHLGQRQP